MLEDSNLKKDYWDNSIKKQKKGILKPTSGVPTATVTIEDFTNESTRTINLNKGFKLKLNKRKKEKDSKFMGLDCCGEEETL